MVNTACCMLTTPEFGPAGDTDTTAVIFVVADLAAMAGGHDERWASSVQITRTPLQCNLYFTTDSRPKTAGDESWGVDNVYVWVR